MSKYTEIAEKMLGTRLHPTVEGDRLEDGYNEMHDKAVPIVADLLMRVDELEEYKRIHEGESDAHFTCVMDNVLLIQELSALKKEAKLGNIPYKEAMQNKIELEALKKENEILKSDLTDIGKMVGCDMSEEVTLSDIEIFIKDLKQKSKKIAEDNFPRGRQGGIEGIEALKQSQGKVNNE